LVAPVLAIVVAAGPASAAESEVAATPACRWADAAGVDTTGLAGPTLHDASPTRPRQAPLLRDAMLRPFAAPCQAAALLGEARRAGSPAQLLRSWATTLAGMPTQGRPPLDEPAHTERSDVSHDELRAALAAMQPLADARGMPWPPSVPDAAALPPPLRGEIARMLAATHRASEYLDRALADLPPGLDPSRLREQWLVVATPHADDGSDLRQLLPRLDRAALLAGFVELAEATERLQRFLASAPALPPVAWRVDTPRGAVVVDTTGRSNAHHLAAPLLVVDVGGDDRYAFDRAPPARHVAVVVDVGGNDRYVAHTDGADPSAATLGYGVLWDTGGDDRFDGAHFAQGAALFGAALLVAAGGDNRFDATGHAQGWATGGLALLWAGPGRDAYLARTHAQASGGPEGLAVMVDRGGDDRYTLANTPLVRASPQLPTHNTSMGQGAGRGLRPTEADGLSATGGVGILADLGGDDRYEAQVFAQGTGFHEGVGLLLDGGGADRFDAAWYAMGAAAHAGVGMLLEQGRGNDRYRATRSTSLGAAHDASVAIFVDEGGDDAYALGDLGYGASHDGGVALFADLGGRNAYEMTATTCRAFGFVQADGQPGAWPPRAGSPAVFVDLGLAGDRLPVACRRGEHPLPQLAR
jgi:hypothetical protein